MYVALFAKRTVEAMGADRMYLVPHRLAWDTTPTDPSAASQAAFLPT